MEKAGQSKSTQDVQINLTPPCVLFNSYAAGIMLIVHPKMVEGWLRGWGVEGVEGFASCGITPLTICSFIDIMIFRLWPVGQTAKTRPFHGWDKGSIPLRVIFYWRHSQAVRQRSATPLSPVQIRVVPEKRKLATSMVVSFCCLLMNKQQKF